VGRVEPRTFRFQAEGVETRFSAMSRSAYPSADLSVMERARRAAATCGKGGHASIPGRRSWPGM